MKKYKWKYSPSQNSGISAQVVGKELERLEKKYSGALLPSTIVKEATPKKSKLHDCFEWNNKKAGDAHRITQARELLRKIVVVYEEPKGGGKRNVNITVEKEIRGFWPIKSPHNSGYYTRLENVIQDDELRENVFEQIRVELKAVKKKYDSFKSSKALQKVWDVIEALDEELVST